MLRYGVIAHAVNQLLAAQGRLLERPGPVTPAALSFANLSLNLVLVAMWWVYVRRLLLRVPRPDMATAAQFTMVAVLVCAVVRHWLPWALIWVGMWELGLELSVAPAVRVGEGVFNAAAAFVAALAARAVGDIARNHAGGQNPDGGESSQETG